MNDDCDCFIGYTLSTRDEIYEEYYLSDTEDEYFSDNDIFKKFDCCPYCGSKIKW